MPNPSSTSEQISRLILARLGLAEAGVLGLVVAVRKDLAGRRAVMKGDLNDAVKAALRKLVAADAVVEADGTYGLSPRSKRATAVSA